MPGSRLKYEGRSLCDWVCGIHSGRIALPTFQRSSVWDLGRIKSLILSLLRDRPVGTLLLIPADESRFRSRSIKGPKVGAPAPTGGELVLDGQQRLTALWRALHNEPEALFVEVRDWSATPLSAASVSTASELGLRTPGHDEDAAVRQFDRRCIPFSVLGVDGVSQPEDAVWKWCNLAMRNDGEKARCLNNRIKGEIAQPFLDRCLWHLTLPDAISREEAIDIFVRTNESSAVIRRFDIAVAHYDSDTGSSLRMEIRRMFDEMGEKQTLIHRFFETGDGDDDLIPVLGEVFFKVSCLWCEFAPTEGKYTKNMVLDVLRYRRSELRDALVWALDFYQQEGIPERRFVPSDVPIRVLPALHPVVRPLERTAEAKVRRYLRAYLWRAFLTDRYSRSANTRLHEDYRAMEKNLRAETTASTERWMKGVPIFGEGHYGVPRQRELADLDDDPLRSPRTRNSLARAIFAISLREGRDFATGQRTGTGVNQEWHYHHLFPKEYLRKRGRLGSRQVNHGLNFALVTGKTNGIILDKPPHEYLTADGALARAANGATGDELPRLVESHRIPYEALVAAPRADAPAAAEVERLYRAFIGARARMMHRAMVALAKGQGSVRDD